MQQVWQIRQATGVEGREYYYGARQPATWMPADFGQARMAAQGWLLALAQRNNKGEEFIQARRAVVTPHRRELLDRNRWLISEIMAEKRRELFCQPIRTARSQFFERHHKF